MANISFCDECCNSGKRFCVDIPSKIALGRANHLGSAGTAETLKASVEMQTQMQAVFVWWSSNDLESLAQAPTAADLERVRIYCECKCACVWKTASEQGRGVQHFSNASAWSAGSCRGALFTPSVRDMLVEHVTV